MGSVSTDGEHDGTYDSGSHTAAHDEQSATSLAYCTEVYATSGQVYNVKNGNGWERRQGGFSVEATI